MSQNGKTRGHLTPVKQLLLAWNAGTLRQEAWITSQIRSGALNEDGSFVPWLPFPDHNLSPDFRGLWFPLGSARSLRLGWIPLLKLCLFLRANWKLCGIRRILSRFFDGRRTSSGARPRSVARARSAKDSGSKTTSFVGKISHTTEHEFWPELDEELAQWSKAPGKPLQAAFTRDCEPS